MEQRHAQNKQKVDNCFTQLTNMGTVQKSQMWKFYRNVSKAWVELDKEFVSCRRIKHFTPAYTDAEQNLDECIKVFEQYSIVAALMY